MSEQQAAPSTLIGDVIGRLKKVGYIQSAVIAALIIGVIVAASISAHNYRLAYEYAERLNSAESELTTLRKTAEDRRLEIIDLGSEVAAYERREDAIAEGEADIAARVADVEAREAAITARETIIAQNTFAGNGRYVVGVDIQPGRYRSSGGDGCYWARLNSNGDDIIDNYFGDGQTTIVIQPTDGMVEVSSCGAFTKF